MKNNILSNPILTLIISLVILIFIYYPVFYSNYAYLDEIHQLWNNHDNSNYTIVFIQARWLTAIFINGLFANLTTISDLKITRIISFLSWALFLIAYFKIGKKWQALIGFDPILFNLSGIYIVCSISVAIAVGWGSCCEVGIANLFGLWSGHLLFKQSMLHDKWREISKSSIIAGLIAGVGSLFLHQIAFGTFLIPFAIYLIHNKTAAKFKIFFRGVGAYSIITILYYLMFLLSLKITDLPASDRTNFSFDILGKLGFFFGFPLSHAFSLNFLYNSHSLMSQAFPILMIIFWIIFLFKNEKNTVVKKLVYIILFVGLCMFIYLPLLVGKESFSSYRTMFALNYVVAFALLETAINLIRTNQIKNTFAIFIAACFVTVGYRNFNFNFIDPLKREYHSINNFVDKNYHPGIDTIYFLRPPEHIFYSLYNVDSYNDEFGVASTFKDWTPAPLIKQLIFEKTFNRGVSENITVIQFTEKSKFDEAVKNNSINRMAVDIPVILTRDK